jgi:hypothetical protein
VLAVALVVGVIAIIGLVRGDSSTGDGGNASVSQTVLVTSHSSSPTPTPTLTSSTPATTMPTTSAPPPPTTTAPPAVATPAPAATKVEVYNVSHRRGLAQSESGRLRGQGYQVTHVRNRIGYPLAKTTVFYAPGNATAKAAADGVVARHLGVVVAAPRPANVPASGALIVYVAASYS